MRVVVAINDPPVWAIPASQVARLADALPDDEVIDARDAATRLAAFSEADVGFATRIAAEEFAAARRLRWLQSSAVGVGGLLLPEVVASSVTVTNARGAHSDVIAEHAVALLLALRRQLDVAMTRQAACRWAQAELSTGRMPRLDGTEVLVIGLGAIGGRIARLLAALGMHVTGLRRHPRRPAPPGISRVLGPGDLHAALRTADAVVLALPRTPETRTLIGRDELARMKPSALLVNVARGRLVDEAALLEALEAGRLGGAGLDAFQQEPLPADHPLWRARRAIITPHSASFDGDYWTPAVDLFLENVGRFRRGEPLLNVVDKRKGY